ncbi:hypothetical protein VNO78_11428 [Psophocarpus tetragonolobus]|uniref:Uncharacterized protein n=1 Tax=Psophocarpus tetragonolobus TaxID=3891 RepID=A0AAN9SLS2_PSOTE
MSATDSKQVSASIIFISNIPNLVGPFPKTLLKLTKLHNLYIHYTNVSGNIPHFLSQLETLQVLDLGYNSLSGNLPASLSSLPNLAEISFLNNRITGTIPDSFGLFSKNMKAILLSRNRLTGKIPTTFVNLDLQIVNLSGNMLEGDASMLFGSDKSTEDISLGENKLAFDLGKVRLSSHLINLDLRENLIYGSLPKELTTLKYLESLNVSYNYLCGLIPQGGSLQKFDISSYHHNKCLCGSPLPSCKY